MARDRPDGALVIDCMACLVSLGQGVPEGGVFVDKHGIAHATVRSQHLVFFACTVRLDPNNPGRLLIDWAHARGGRNDR